MWDLRLCYVSIKSEQLTPSQLFSFPFSSFSWISPLLHTLNPKPIPTNISISIFVFHFTPLIPQNSLFPLHRKLYNCLWILVSSFSWTFLDFIYIYIYILLCEKGTSCLWSLIQPTWTHRIHSVGNPLGVLELFTSLHSIFVKCTTWTKQLLNP